MESKELCKLFHKIDYQTLFNALVMFELKGEELSDEVLRLSYQKYLDDNEYTGLIPVELRQDIIEIIQLTTNKAS